ncbi:MAG TPA: hypothetical protein VFA45_18245 [Actinomycetes bacterium]|jgi:hypothetical protein|nr:hypothetical protein [Actinomycetes bacterium]
MLGGYAPVQGEGIVDGHAWYFRARWAGWSFLIAAPAEFDWTARRSGPEGGRLAYPGQGVKRGRHALGPADPSTSWHRQRPRRGEERKRRNKEGI